LRTQKTQSKTSSEPAIPAVFPTFGWNADNRSPARLAFIGKWRGGSHGGSDGGIHPLLPMVFTIARRWPRCLGALVRAIPIRLDNILCIADFTGAVARGR
jgi:hypothetical protein